MGQFVHPVNFNKVTSNSIDIQVKPIQALERGLKVFRLLEYEKSMSILELVRESRLPRVTLLRILKTLGMAGFVGRDTGNGRYFALPRGDVSDELTTSRILLSELTAPHRVTLEQQIPWPVNMAVPDKFDMLILDTKSACCLTPNYHALGYRPPMLVSAVGKAYLASCDKNIREMAIDSAMQNGRLRRNVNADALRSELWKIRQTGYALYSSSHASRNSPAQYGALAVPIFCGRRCVASLAVVWIPGVMNGLQVVHAYLEKLQSASGAMSHALTATDMLTF